jgi:uncharacterized protein (UPF0332 family)
LDNIREYVEIRIKDAEQLTDTVEKLLEIGDIRSATNRLYYIFFYLMSALVSSRKLSCKTHSGLSKTFTREFILTGIFPKEIGKAIHTVFDLRIKADYSMAPKLIKDDIKLHLKTAEKFILMTKQYLNMS